MREVENIAVEHIDAPKGQEPIYEMLDSEYYEMNPSCVVMAPDKTAATNHTSNDRRGSQQEKAIRPHIQQPGTVEEDCHGFHNPICVPDGNPQ